MRQPLDRERVLRFMRTLGAEAEREARVYFTGGATAVLLGWWWLWISVPLILAGCLYHAHYVSHGDGASLDRSETSPDLVKVVTAKEVDRPYRTIGIVHAPASLTERDAIAALKRRARTLGGDALLDVRRQAAGSSADQASSALAAAWEADVIVWTDHQAGGAPQPPPG
jgi:hypothetical protein